MRMIMMMMMMRRRRMMMMLEGRYQQLKKSGGHYFKIESRLKQHRRDAQGLFPRTWQRHHLRVKT